MERAKPDIETFFGVPIKVFCGACGRIMFTIHGDGWFEEIQKAEKTCWHCGTEIDWEPKEVKK